MNDDKNNFLNNDIGRKKVITHVVKLQLAETSLLNWTTLF